MRKCSWSRWQAGVWAAAVMLLALAALGQVMAPAAGGAGAAAAPIEPVHEKAALVPIDGMIDAVTLHSVERRVDEARKAGCTLVIYQINATSGLMRSALAISTFTKKTTGEQMAVAAWVRGNASGAAGLVALSCPQLVMADGGAVGAVDSLQLPAAGATPPPVMADLDDSAMRAKIDRAIMRAMVAPEAELIEMNNAATGETRYVNGAQSKMLLEEKAAAPGGGVAARPWHVVGDAKRKGETLVVTAPQALEMGVSKATVNSVADLRAVMNVRGDLMELDLDFLEKTARFLTQPWVRFLLLVGALTLGWMELSHPGISLPGILAVICLALLLGGPYVTGLATGWEIVAIVAGVAIILADLFVVGSLGMLAVPGFILMAVGLVASFIPTGVGGGLDFGEGWESLRNGVTVVVGAMVVSLMAFVLLAKYLRMTPGFRRLQLAPAGGGAVAATDYVRDAADRPATEAVFVGAIGVAHTQLRPAGKGRFGEHLVNVSSFGPFIAAGTEIEVIEATGRRVTVRPRRASAGGAVEGGPA